MYRFLSKDFLSGLMFIAFGLAALHFGQKLALGTPVRMGPGFVPRMLSFILLCLGSVIVMTALLTTADKREKERYWIPLAGISVLFFVFSLIPWGSAFIGDSLLGGEAQRAYKAMPIPFIVPTILLVDVVILLVLIALFGRPGVMPEDLVETPKWRPITMVTIGILLFAFLFERAGLLPALVSIVLVASLGNRDFKITEVIGNMVVLAILCTLVFKVGLGMNISIVRGVW